MPRVMIAPAAAATLRGLSRERRRAVAERLDALAAGNEPGDAAPFAFEAGGVRVACVGRPDGSLLVAHIEELGGVAASAAFASLRASLHRATRVEEATGPRRTRAVRGMEPATGRIRFMDVMYEIRFALRSLRRDLGIVVLAVVALGVGIGLPAAMFGVVDASVGRGLPVEDGDRIMHLERRPYGASGEGWGVPPRDVRAWREQQRSFESLEVVDFSDVTVRIDDASDRHSAVFVTPGTFAVLGVPAVLGRVLDEADGQPGAEPVVVLGHSVWRDRMGASRDAVGRVVLVDGRPYTVVGVMPEGFQFPQSQELWLPYPLQARATGAGADQPTVGAFGRLASGVSLGEARAEMDVVARRLAQQWPETNRDLGIAVKPFTQRYMGETPTTQMRIVLAAVLLVLVVACANVANLLIVRAVRRMRDAAVRAALGATRARLVAQSLVESAVLAAGGGIIGVAVGTAVLGVFRNLFGTRMPYWVELRMDARTLLFVGTLTIAAAVLAGLLPALKGAGRDLAAALRDETRGSTGIRVGRTMRVLVVVEMALSVALLAGTGLLARSARQAQPDQLGLPYANVLTGKVALADETPYDARVRYANALLQRIAASPEASAVALASNLPATRAPRLRGAREDMTYERYDAQPPMRRVVVTPGFFELFGAAPIRGRFFADEDGAASEPIAILNASAARTLFGTQDPVGARVRVGRDEDQPWRTVVGVTPDLWAGGLDSTPDRNPPALYIPFAQAPPVTIEIAVRARGTPQSVAPALREATSAVDPDVPLFAVASMETVIIDNGWFYGMAATIFALCGLATLVLATVGLYGVIAFSVDQRTREFGIRMAMGADPRDILRLVVRGGMAQVLIGLGLGLGLAVFIMQGLSALLFDVRPTDPLVLGLTVALLIAIALTALLVPAGRAARADPLESLRAE